MGTEVFSVSAKVTGGDIDAALSFVQKRARKRPDAVEGVSAALFSVMFATCEGLVACGLSIENVDSLLDQFRQQVLTQIKIQQGIDQSDFH